MRRENVRSFLYDVTGRMYDEGSVRWNMISGKSARKGDRPVRFISDRWLVFRLTGEG